mmetsp:Transcript_8856/g.26359  ORF Transcript_8856/g.26359 Transcript_8856/m.26359 type:complete len:463 (+) Transcript_8856:192-1580(+)
MRDACYFDDLFGQRELEETVLVVDAQGIWPAFRSNASPSAGNHPSGGEKEVAWVFVMDLLVVHMTSDHQINAVFFRHGLPIPCVPRGREVCHHDLPSGLGAIEGVLQPRHLLLPQVLEPARALPYVFDAELAAAVLVGVHMLLAADIVLRVGVGLLGLDEVRIDEEIIHRKARVVHVRRPVLSRRHPAAARAPRIGDVLVPTCVELVAAVVVVAQDAQPRLAVDALALVNLLENPLELARRRVRERRHQATLGVEPRPIKVISSIEEVIGRVVLGPLAHLRGHLRLRLVVDALDEISRCTLARGHGAMRAQHAAPIGNHVHAVRALLFEARRRQADAVVVGGQLGRRRCPEALLAIVGKARLVGPPPPTPNPVLERSLVGHEPLLHEAHGRMETCRGSSRSRCGSSHGGARTYGRLALEQQGKTRACELCRLTIVTLGTLHEARVIVARFDASAIARILVLT